ncbi:MAG TPA: helicase-related protein, partial [Polyangiaceae bacterium]|nr:helicase-related protein [Polyangiaceae bacterium]
PDIKRIAETRLRKPEFITLSGDQVGALEIRHFVYLSRGDKLTELLEIIETEDPESAVIFTNTRDETKRVAAALAQEGYAADWLNADLAQHDREKVMAATREGRLRFLVATDVAARGIDISHLTHVINFDFPESAEAYVHRTGRTGRAGRTGTAISLVEPSDIGNLYLLRLTYKLKPIERNLPTRTERKTRAETDLVRWFVEGFAARPVHPDDLALARRLLSHERAEAVVAGLLRDHLGARAEAQEEATAARRSRATRVAEEAERGSRPRAEAVVAREPVEKKAPKPRAAPAPHGAEDASEPVSERAVQEAKESPRKPAEGPELERGEALDEESSVELYASVGRRQGARPGDYERLLLDSGIPAQAIAYIRVRHRNTFVGVAPETVDLALQALDGKVVAGNRVKAELSRGRTKAPLEGEDVEAARDEP